MRSTHETFSRTADATREAAAAASLLSTRAAAASSASGGYGLTQLQLQQYTDALNKAQNLATNINRAVSDHQTAIASKIDSGDSVSSMGGAVASAAAAVNQLAATIPQVLTGAAVSGSKTRLSMLTAAGVAAANAASSDVAVAAATAASNTTDTAKKSALTSISTAAANNATEQTLADNAATVAQAFSGVGTISTAVTNMSTAVTNAGSYVSNLTSVTAPTTGCVARYQQLANGDVQITATFGAAQSYVEVFLKVGANQVAAGDVVGSGVSNGDGTWSYKRIVPASYFTNGAQVTYRFYSFITGQLGVFTPGPQEMVWFPAVTYSTTSPPNVCQ
jgi:hypothetical protein